jgi:hypothetical protein
MIYMLKRKGEILTNEELVFYNIYDQFTVKTVRYKEKSRNSKPNRRFG